jgi:large subunit ribosomal protein L34e
MNGADRKRATKREKHVTRAYGGNICSRCVKKRIIRAFLIEEIKLGKAKMAQKKSKAKA